jgi:hypothetical protein
MNDTQLFSDLAISADNKSACIADGMSIDILYPLEDT